ncbi:MAG TPA: T9SS type A sorting domain-containing protein, partial [Bacteroidia bacterium]|nr:T9SS type A sorting domain-containing protein [Bacteroidia bacterium]
TSRIYAGGTGFIRSDDDGATWPTVSADPIDNGNYVLSIAVSATHEDSVYMATAPDISPMKLMLSVDGGNNFVDRSAGLPNRYPRRIAVDPRNSQVVYVVFAGFGTGHVFKSINAGVTWTDISTNLPDVPFHCVMMDPQFPNVVYVGSDMGIYVSTDAGTTWTTFNTGIPDWTMVYDLVPCAANRSFLCFTHGHGAWTRSLNDMVAGVENVTQTPFTISVFPNPATENVNLVFGESTGPVKITIRDMQGKRVFSKEITLDPASPDIRIDAGEWANGCYIIQAVNGNKTGTQRILVAH